MLVDKTGPSAPQINLVLEQPSTVQAEWTCSDLQSEVEGYQYSIGTIPGSSDVLAWQSLQETQATVSDMPIGKQLCFNVKARNQFGYWSETGISTFVFRRSISDQLDHPDGTNVKITGIVTGVFDGYYYVEQENKSKGLRIMGNCEHQIGSQITVNGVLTTSHGERAVTPELK